MTTEGKIYTTNLWQTKGIVAHSNYRLFDSSGREYVRSGAGCFAIGRDAFVSLDEAKAAVEAERIKAIVAVEKRLEKLRNMEIKVTEEE